MQEFLREVNPRPSPRPHPTCSKVTSSKPIVPDLSFAESFKEASLINQNSSETVCQKNPDKLELEDPNLPDIRKIIYQTDRDVEEKEKYNDKSAPDAQLPMIIERVQKILKNAERRQQELQDCLLATEVDKLNFLNENDSASALEQVSSQSFKVTGKLPQTDHTDSFSRNKRDLDINMEKVAQFRNTPAYLFDPNVSFLLLDNKVFTSSFEVKMCPLHTVVSNENFDDPLKSSIFQVNSELAIKEQASLDNFRHLPSKLASPDSVSSCCKCNTNCYCDSGHPSSLTSEQIYSEAESIDNDQFSLVSNYNLDMAKKMKSSSESKTVSTDSLADENLTLGDVELNSVTETCESPSCTIHLDLKEYPDSILCSYSEHCPYPEVQSVMEETKDSENKNFSSREMNSEHGSWINCAPSSKNSMLEESFLKNSTKVNWEEESSQISNNFSSNDVFLDSIIGLHPRHLMYNHLAFNQYQSLSDVNFSLQLNHLADKYLTQETVNPTVCKTIPVLEDLPETTLSFASKQYLRKHKLLNSAIIPTTTYTNQEHPTHKKYKDSSFIEQARDVYSSNRILNIEHLKRQSKLL